jgi:hypothetical protein
MGAKPSMVSAFLKGDRRLNKDWIEKLCAEFPSARDERSGYLITSEPAKGCALGCL